MNRTNKTGRGAALYVDRRLKYYIVEGMIYAIEDVCECITIEIVMEKKRNIIVSCVYRAPSFSIEVFKNWMEDMFTKMEQKVTFIGGGY